MPTRYLLIKGKVQGVFFRDSARKEALRLGITGWIRNTASGDVECVASGEPAALDMFIAWCNTGPDRARVAELQVEEKPEKIFSSFTIEH